MTERNEILGAVEFASYAQAREESAKLATNYQRIERRAGNWEANPKIGKNGWFARAEFWAVVKPSYLVSTLDDATNGRR